tara:strand:+ start:4996 stop:5439 length:444 start_codon:yes stop_codon:yes gene_type:complete
MKLDQLRTIIREEVRAAVKEELQEVMTEAIKIASKPEKTFYEAKAPYPVAKTGVPSKINPIMGDPIMEMLNQTKASMTQNEHKNLSVGSNDMVQRPNFASTVASNMGMTESRGAMPGLDISQFDFVKKAGDVYKASVIKDKQKYGLT